MVSISAVVITYNEENKIARCLTSLRDIADEIVVVDSFSTDKTEDICKEFGVRFIKHAFEGFVEQKRWTVQQAKHDHVLFLDADEALSIELSKSILQKKQNWTHDGYTFNRLTNYCGSWIKHSGWYPDRKLRLWDRRKGEETGTNPHEYVQMFPGASVAHLKGDLFHYSYDSIAGHVQQANKFTDLTAKHAFEKGKRASIAKVIASPIWKFLRNYVIKGGFLDGYPGFCVCFISAFASFLKYSKIRELTRSSQ